MRGLRTKWLRLAVASTVAALVVASVPALAGGSVASGGKKNRGTIGYVVAGDRNDGGFYQGQVESVTKTAKKLGYKVIVVDKVNPGAAQEAFENLCRQGVNLIVGGGSELTDGFIPVSESPECEDINFILVAGFPPTGNSFATVAANENEAHYMGGVAAGLLLEQNGGNTACVVGGPDLPFVRAMEEQMTAGLESVAPDKEMLVTLTGDFEDAALATEALQAQIDRGCTLFYPYLGGALPAAVELAANQDIGVISTSVNLCGIPPADFFGANIVEGILYNPALFLPTVLKQYSKGKIKEGKQFALYGVGDSKKLGLKDPNDGPGAVLCDATPEQQATLDQVRQDIKSGKIEITPGG